MRLLFSTLLLGATITLASCDQKQKKDDYTWVKNGIETAAFQLRQSATQFADSALFPRSVKEGKVRLVDPEDWTSGFFPGSLWYEYKLTGDDFFKKEAEKYTALLHDIQYYKGTHDLGFMMFCSYGNQLLLQKDTAKVAPILVETAESLISRFNPEMGVIRSWDFGDWNFPVIIDNMMNLDLLFWASRYTQNPKYREIAMTHADNTIKNHFRQDMSSYHVVSYNNDGSVESQGTFQGNADSSAWARGQAWGLYGYVSCYRETGEARYLEQAQKIASLIMNHPSIPEDLIPYWDYNAPNIPNAPRDASAAAVTACALLELSTMTGEQGKTYFDYAENILKNLSGENYLAAKGTNGGFILKHSVGHLPANSEIDTPLNYADYYYLEGIDRYLMLKGLDAQNL